jgi:hypothetical protein
MCRLADALHYSSPYSKATMTRILAILTLACSTLAVGLLAGLFVYWRSPLILHPSSPLVENGVAAMMVCGEGDGFAKVM